MEHERRHDHILFDVLAGALALVFSLFGVIPFFFHESSFPPLGIPSRIVMGVLGLASFCLLALLARLASRVRALTFRRIMLWSCVFTAIFLVLPPIGSADLWNYVVRVREWTVHGLNPFTVPSNFVSTDLFFSRSPMQWHENTVNYGPLWMLLMAPIEMLAQDSFILHLTLYRLVPIVFFGLSVLLVRELAKRYFPERIEAITILYAWNPLVLFEVANNGHNDILMVALLLAAWVAFERRMCVWVLPLVFASALIKYISLLLVPFAFLLLWKAIEKNDRARVLGKSLAMSAALVAASFAPFWQGPATLSGILTQGSYFIWQYQSPFAFLGFVGANAFGMARSSALTLVFGGAIGLFGAWVAWHLVLAARRSFSFGELWFRIALGYLLTASFLVAPWFMLWILPFGVLCRRRVFRQLTFIFSVAALLSYALPFLSLLLVLGLVALFGLFVYHLTSHVFIHTT